MLTDRIIMMTAKQVNFRDLLHKMYPEFYRRVFLQCKLMGRSIFLAPVHHVSSSWGLHIAMLASFYSLSGKVQYLEHTWLNQLQSQGLVNLLRWGFLLNFCILIQILSVFQRNYTNMPFWFLLRKTFKSSVGLTQLQTKNIALRFAAVLLVR